MVTKEKIIKKLHNLGELTKNVTRVPQEKIFKDICNKCGKMATNLKMVSLRKISSWRMNEMHKYYVPEEDE